MKLCSVKEYGKRLRVPNMLPDNNFLGDITMDSVTQI